MAPRVFSRRRGSTGQTLGAPVSSSAAIAASSAFLKNAPSGGSLSSAAAAAALRSHTTTPEPVGNIQTKRMARRGSHSSNGSGTAIEGSFNVQGNRPSPLRRNSSGSMAERTFRSPSPAARESPHRARPAAADAPPVPRLSAEQQLRAANNQKAAKASVRPAALQIGSDSEGMRGRELERDNGGRSSVNFSRPIASPTETPPVSPTRPKTAGSWFNAPVQTIVKPRQAVTDRPKTSSGIAQRDISGIESALTSVANTPPKKKQVTSGKREGAQLASKTIKPSPTGTAVNGPQIVKTATGPTESSHSGDSAQPVASQRDAPQAGRRKSPSPANGTRISSGQLHKQPSVVMEESETEEALARRAQNGAYPRMGASKTPANTPAAALSVQPRTPKTATTDASGSPAPRQRPSSLVVPDGHGKSAHFSDTDPTDQAYSRHDPPPRSVSPAKSALKHSPSSSIRTSSPVATFSPPTSKPPASDTSDTTSLTSQDAIRLDKRKKNRVSFDDDANRTIPDPNDAMRANGAGKDNRRSLSPGLSDIDFDESMKPRPALPSFGSVRTPTPREEQSGVAEKVTETIHPASSRPSTLLQGVSNDHLIGAILANQKEKNDRSSDTDEPLPPEVTTVEGSGHFSDSAESSEDEAETSNAPPAVNLPAAEDASSNTQHSTRQDMVTPQNAGGSIDVPDIHVLPATPGFEETPTEAVVNDESGYHNVAVPGAWGDDEEPKESSAPIQAAKATSTLQPSGSPQMSNEVDTDSDDSEAFSDAAEDPSEMETFGYASLDAIVESPAVGPNKAKERSAPSASPLLGSSPEMPSPSEEGKDWSRTSAYWSNQKQQLQRRESEQDETEEDMAPPVVVPEPEIAAPKKTRTSESAPAKKQTQPKQAQAPRQKPMKTSMRGPSAQQSEERPVALRKSMRSPVPSSPPPEARQPLQSRAKQSLTEEKPVALRKSMRSPVPSSPPPETRQPLQSRAKQGETLRKTMRPQSPPNVSAVTAAPPVGRAAPSKAIASNADSDSESSFKRKRRSPSADNAGRYSMRRSMRSGSLDLDQGRRPSSSQGPPGPGRWSLRSMSPPPETPQSVRSNMRSSLRGIPEGPSLRGGSTMRGPTKPEKTSGRFSMSSFSKQPKASAAPTKATVSGKSGFSSRFADSDSEDEAPSVVSKPAPRTGFRSRFADSDDEDDQPRHIAADLTPVRGIPRPKETAGEDSSDLDDSSDDEFSRRRRAKRDSGRSIAKPVVPSQADRDKAMNAARQNVAAMTGNQDLLEGPSTPSGKVQKRHTAPASPSPPTKPATPAATESPSVTRRRTLLGSIFGRRHSQNLSPLTTTTTNNSTASPMSRPAHVRTMSTQTDDTAPQSPSSPRTGKLQRRRGPNRTASGRSIPQVEDSAGTPHMAAVTEGNEEETGGEWPLPPPPRIPAAEAEGVRPASSDGVAEGERKRVLGERPGVGRRSQSGVLPGEKMGASAKKGKEGKKRWGRLRRAFGLDD